MLATGFQNRVPTLRHRASDKKAVTKISKDADAELMQPRKLASLDSQTPSNSAAAAAASPAKQKLSRSQLLGLPRGKKTIQSGAEMLKTANAASETSSDCDDPF